MKLLFYNTDLTPWADYVIPADYLKIERHFGLDEIQIVTIGEGLIFRLVDALCCHVIEDNKMSMWMIDRPSITETGTHEVRLTLYEPLWLLNHRVANKREFEEVSLQSFANTVITENTTGDRQLGNIDLSALSGLSAANKVTCAVDGEPLADLLIEEFNKNGLKLYFTVSVSSGMALKIGIQEWIENGEYVLSTLFRNVALNISKITKGYETVYVSGEYRRNHSDLSNGESDNVVLRGYFTYGGTGLVREEHHVKTQISSDGITQQEYQKLLHEEARSIAKKRKVTVDITAVSEIITSIQAMERFNRAGVVFPVEIDTKIHKYVIDEIKTTPTGVTFTISQKEVSI